MGVSVHYRGLVTDIRKINFIDEKIASVKAELSRVTKGHIEIYSINELASMIEALLHYKLD